MLTRLSGVEIGPQDVAVMFQRVPIPIRIRSLPVEVVLILLLDSMSDLGPWGLYTLRLDDAISTRPTASWLDHA